jgi:hypothetical protein
MAKWFKQQWRGAAKQNLLTSFKISPPKEFLWNTAVEMTIPRDSAYRFQYKNRHLDWSATEWRDL